MPVNNEGNEVVDLSGGYVATIYKKTEVPERKDRAVREAFRAAVHAEVEAEKQGYDHADPETYHLLDFGPLTNYTDTVIGSYVKSWTKDEPVPTPETAADLSKDDYEALARAAKQVFQGIDFTPDGADDPKADTGESNA